MKKIFLFLQLVSFTSILNAQTMGTTKLYVAVDGSDKNTGLSIDQPLQTISKAINLTRTIKNDRGPIVIYLREGIHQLKKPLVFGPDDSGSKEAPVTFRAYGQENVMISGGKSIEGWKKYRKNIWRTYLPEVKDGNWYFSQLFVTGALRKRARTPNEGFYRVQGFPDGGREVHYHTDCQRFEFAEGDIDPGWTNLEDVEVIVYHFWTDSHLPIQSIDSENNLVTFQHKAGKVFTDDFTDGGARYIVENVWEGLDQPGEWYLNRKSGYLYYIPLEGEDLNYAEVIAPIIPELVRIEGDPLELNYVEHLNFENINFKYTNWQLPPGNSNDRQGSASVPAAITLTGARNTRFERCTVKNIGTWAFEIENGSSNNEFKYNDLSYLAAGGFRINGGTGEDPPLSRTGYNLISDNVIHHFGEVFPSAVGVLLMNTNSNQVLHNEIHHGWYTGVSIGWSWGYQRSISRDNKVEYNHIHHIGQGLLSDMGAIYTLGVSPGTTIRNNLIHDVNANHYGGWGIYNDEGSTHILIENNIVYNTKFAGYNIHFAKEVTVRNNIFALSRLQQLSRSRVEPHQSVYFENNIVYWKEGELLDNNWSDKKYQFYFHPKNDSGTRELTSTFEMDYNLYFNPSKPVTQISFNGKDWKEWQSMGKDQHSVYADPLFVDPDSFHFRLQENSPVFKLGFKPIDQDKIGPRL